MRTTLLAVPLLTLGCTNGRPSATPDVPAARRADSWAQFAGARESDAEALEQALEVLARAEDATADADTVRALQAAYDVTVDTTRNRLRTAWLLAGRDATLEFFDAPLHGAAEQAVDGALGPFAQGSAGLRPTPFVLRTRRLGAPEDPELQVVASSAAEAVAGLYPVSLEGPQGSLAELAGTAGQLEVGGELLVVDVAEVDRFYREEGDWDLPVTRVDAEATLVEVPTGRVLARHSASGFTQDLRHRWGVPGLWALLMAAGAVATTGIAWWRERRRSRTVLLPPLSAAAAVGVAGYLAGLGLSTVATELSGSFLPDWSQNAVLVQLGWLTVPHPAALLWPAAHGAVVMLGPVLLLAWAALKVQGFADVKLLQWVNPERLLAVVAPAAQAGALTTLFAAAVAAEPGLMWSTASPIAVAALLSSLALARPTADLMAGSPRPWTDAGAALVASLGLVLLLPVGLFSHWALPTAGAATALAAVALVSTRERRAPEPVRLEPASPAPAVPTASASTGSLDDPHWVSVVDQVELGERLEEDRALVICGPSRSGLSRCVQEVLKQASSSVELDCSRLGGSAATAPFGAVAALLEQLDQGAAAFGARSSALGLQATVQAGVEQTLSVIPPVAAVLGLVEREVDLAGVQRSRVIEEGARLVAHGLERGGHRALVLSSVEYLDPSSDEVLARVAVLAPGLRWLLTHRGGTGGPPALTAALSRASAAELPRFTLDQTAELIEKAGVVGVRQELVDALQGASGGLPGVLLGQLRDLRDEGLLEPVGDGPLLKPVEGLDAATLRAHCPDFRARVLQRMGRLDAESRELLEVAAICGRTFTAAEVATASARSLVATARRLSRLAAGQAPLLDELPSVPGWFAFRSSLIHDTLASAVKGSEGRASELARAVHLRVAMPPQDAAPVPPERMLHHALRAPTIARHAAVALTRSILERMAARVAWPEVERVLREARCLEGQGHWSDEVGVALVAARLAGLRGGPEDRARSVGRLETLIERGLVDGRDREMLFPAVLAWGDLLLQQHRGRSTEPVAARCRELRSLGGPPLLGPTLAFYGLLAGPEPAPVELEALVARVDALAPSRQRSELRSRMLNKLAQWAMMALPKEASVPEARRHFEARVAPLLDETLRLKTALGDVRGQAMVYGMLGRTWLDRLEDPDQAEVWLSLDLELVEERGMDSDLSQVLNLRATARKLQARTQTGEPAEAKRAAALEDASRALDAAERLQRPTDLAFAAVNLCDLWLDAPELGGPHLDRAARHAGSGELWSMVRLRFARDELVSLAERANRTEPRPPWAAQLAPVVASLDRSA
jgi:hypothetical protein